MNVNSSSQTALDWIETDDAVVDTIRVLAMDAVQKTGNGHPGTAMSLAPAAYLLYQRHLRHDPADPGWIGRDRFVLSAGHSSLTLYLQLYLSGYEDVDLDDIKSLRTWGSKTPGHPEVHHTQGVETIIGPLGQGVGNAVGMAMAARRTRGLLDPEAEPGQSPFDTTIYVIASDGDMQEGVASEASSLAGTQELGNLIMIWDANQISIEDDTSVAFGEDTGARYEAYGWHVQHVRWRKDGEQYQENVTELDAAIAAAKAETSRPSFIALHTIIGWPAPNLQDTGTAHGAALGEEEVAATKERLGFDPQQHFSVDDDVLARAREVGDRGAALHDEWREQYQRWAQRHPERVELLERLQPRRLPDGWTDALPTFEPGKELATRAASGEVLSAVAPVLPELWGGSADLAGSNNTTPDNQPSFFPPHRGSKKFTGDWYGRVLHFGIREHAMGSIMNGIALYGLTRPYGGTFLTFSDYMRPAVRLAAIMQAPVTYVWTHDSIGLGEDGPTHQPVEHLAALRAIPGLDIVRPADANETAVVWRSILQRQSQPRCRPAGLALTRQKVRTFPRNADGFASAEGAARGAYVLLDSEGDGPPDVVLIGTGSEVGLAVDARDKLAEQGVRARVVSMPSREWFEAEDQAYQNSVLPPSVRARVSIEAAVAMGWRDVLGDAGRSVSLEHYGASADYQTIYEKVGLTPDAVVDAAHESISAANRA